MIGSHVWLLDFSTEQGNRKFKAKGSDYEYSEIVKEVKFEMMKGIYGEECVFIYVAL